MPDYSSRIGNAASGLGSGASIGLALSPYTAGLSLPIGAGLGLLSGLFSKSDKEIQQEKIREYIKRLTEAKARSLQRLSDEAGKNFGRINQRTTGLIQRGQGDIARRAAGAGHTADEADFLALQGNITGQGSEMIQNTQDEYERMKRQIEDQYDAQINNAQYEGIMTPEDPNLTDVLGSLAPAALTFAMNKDYLKNMPNTMTTPNVNVDTKGAIGANTEIPTFYDTNSNSYRMDKVTDVTKPDYNFMDETQNTNIPRRVGLLGNRRRLPNTYYPRFNY